MCNFWTPVGVVCCTDVGRKYSIGSQCSYQVTPTSTFVTAGKSDAIAYTRPDATALQHPEVMWSPA